MILNENEVSLGFDYVFVGPSGTHVTIEIDLYDTETGEKVTTSPAIRMPIERDQDTVVYGSFLLENADSGIGVDPDFKGDNNFFFDL